MKFLIMGSLFFLMLSCSSAPKSPFQEPSKSDAVQGNEHRLAVEAGERSLAAGKWKEAETQFADFVRRHPISTYSARAYYGQARSLEGQGRYPEAINLYRQVGEQARTTAPDVAAMAYLRLSFCYEALGDENRLVAALTDAETLGESLPEDIRTIQLPARRAASLLRRGQGAEARQILKKVEKALPDVNVHSPMELRQRHADLLLTMGTQQFQGLNAENYLPTLETFEALQLFLWKAMLLKSPPASDQALAQLTEGYSALSKLAFQPPAPQSGQTPASSQRWQEELQKRWVARLMESLQSLKIVAEGRVSEGGEHFASLIGKIDEKANQILWGRQSSTPLTGEAPRSRPVKAKKSEAHFDNSKVAPTVEDSPPENTQDPNLQNGDRP